MAAVQHLLVLCVLAGTLCLAQLDAQSLGAVSYTDCGYGNRQLTVSNVTLYPNSPQPTDTIYLNFNVTNPSTTNYVTVNTIFWTLNFTTPFTGNRTMYDFVVPPGNSTSIDWLSNYVSLNQIYSTGWIPFQLAFYSNYSELACWAGRLYIRAPPNPSDCSYGYGYNQLNLSSVTLNTNVYNQSSYFTLTIENVVNTVVSFNEVYWWITLNSGTYFYNDQELSSPATLGAWGSYVLNTTSVQLPQNVSISWFEYQFAFYNAGPMVACWTGYQVVQPSPPNPPGCFNGNSLLSVNNVVLHPSSPQIHDSIYLTFEIDNWSDVNVTFSHIYYILTFNPNSPIAYNLTLPDLTLPAGEYIGLAGKKVELNQSVSTGTYPYQFVFYSNSTTEVACWGGNVTIRNQGDCLGGHNQLTVTDVILNPNSPQIYDPVNLTFTVENESGRNVAFNAIYWTLTFTPGSPLSYNLTLGTNVILVSGTSLTLNGNSLTLYESISAGTYPYQLEFYENTTKIACWGGDVVVPSPYWSSSLESSSSSYIYFLGLTGLSILFTS